MRGAYFDPFAALDVLDAMEPPIEDGWWLMRESQDADEESENGRV